MSEEAKPEFKLAANYWGFCCITCTHRVLLTYVAPSWHCCNRDGSEVPNSHAMVAWAKDRRVMDSFICEHYRHEFMPPEMFAKLFNVLHEYLAFCREQREQANAASKEKKP